MSSNNELRFEQGRKHRRALLKKLKPNSIALLPAASLQTRSHDTEFNFRQHSDFYYLSGFTEDDALLALIKRPAGNKVVLFCQPKDKTKELWTGILTGPKQAVELLGIDEAWPMTDLDRLMPELMNGCERVYYSIGNHAGLDAQVTAWVKNLRARSRQGAVPPVALEMLDPLIHEMRLFKDAAEIKLMQKAADISARAHCRAMLAAREGRNEYHLEAELQHEFMMSGARFPAYNSIVAAGANACILHYIENRMPLKNGDLVLIDAGCEYEYYAADITRTFPVSGKFSKEQRALYEIVLDAQLKAIEAIKPGVVSDEPHNITVKVITAGLVKLGLLKGKVSTLIKDGAYRDFYMHGAGHWLGIDVHDAGSYQKGETRRSFEPGMVTTIEPGIYVAPDNRKVAKKWRGIGIRIEDDVLVTRNGNRVLTDGVPKTIEDIEALMATRKDA